MVPTRRQKQAVAATSNPLSNASILKQVFTFLPGNYLFLSAVCSEWRAVYAGIADQQVCTFGLTGSPKLVSCGTRTTLFSAAVASPATARLACEFGVLPTNERMQVIAGGHADIQTLAALRELGMPLSEFVVKAAAVSGRLNILQHLITAQQCIIPDELSYYVVRSGSISMLNWLRAEGLCALDRNMCVGAAAVGRLAVLQHLRSEGCDWDEDNIACYAASSGSVEVLEWLRQQQGIDVDAEAMTWAAGAGQTAMCQHLHSVGCGWNADACHEAVLCDQLDTLRWLRANGCPWDVSQVCMQHLPTSLTSSYSRAKS
jgi:hypothetical protein